MTAGVVLGLGLSLVAPSAHAEDLKTLRERAGQVRTQVSTAADNMETSRQNVNSATQKLIDSQNALASARAELSGIQMQLQNARNQDAAIARELQNARAELKKAKEDVAKGEADLAAQESLMGQVARAAYGQHTELEGLSIVFESKTTFELEQRLQWNTTIFDTVSAQKQRLDAVQVKLQQARDRQIEIEAQVASQKAESERQVQVVAGLEAQAASQTAAVQQLVTANTAARSAAQAELDADEKAYRSYQAQEAQIESDIKAEIERLRAEEARRKAEEARKAAEARRKAEEARRQAELKRQQAEAAARAARDKAEREKAAKLRAEAAQSEARASQASRDAQRVSTATYSASSSSRVSSSGFIRPINARPGSPFGMRFHPILHYWRMHNGTDFGAPTGTPLYAARSGKILRAERAGGYGNFVLIGHGDVIGNHYVTTGYAHMSRIIVHRGQYVQQGQLIGYVGSTGLSTTPHLHLEVRLDGRAVNPMIYIP